MDVCYLVSESMVALAHASSPSFRVKVMRLVATDLAAKRLLIGSVLPVHIITYTAFLRRISALDGGGLHASLEGFYEDLRIGFKLVQPFLLKTKVITQEELDVLCQQAIDEMLSEEFCALWFGPTVWGTKLE